MLFSSPVFFLFFALYFALHLIVPPRHRVALIICGSTIFYAWWRVEYTWLPYVLMAAAYAGVRLMSRARDDASRKRYAAGAIAVLFVPLLVFKYTHFIYRDVLGPVFGWRDNLAQLPLPLGVSFMTFTLTAYVVDIYRRRFPSGQPAANVLAYVLFFPHLIAGPILRPHELLPRFEHPRRASRVRLGVPVAIFTIGLVKKLVFADPIAQSVDLVYRQASITGPEALLALYGFAVQIYCDFSGYTDMALGLALLLGVRLPNNFFRPYAADSLVEFWRRWHVTLSFWLRDYLYIPLGGSRQGRLLEARNVMITMALGGLWHGANWTFLVWGLLHGAGVVVSHALKRSADVVRMIPRGLGVLVTFHFVALAWVFFRAPTVSKAFDVGGAVLSGGGWDRAGSVLRANAFTVLLIATFFLVHRFDDHRRIRLVVRRLRPEILWPIVMVLWALAIAISQGSSAKFIYFDF